MTTPAPAPPAGWYPDPSGADGQSYWDGREWGEQPTPPPESKISHKVRNGVLIAVGVFVALAIFGSLLPKPEPEPGKPAASASSTAVVTTTVSAAPSVQVTSTAAAPSTQLRLAPTDVQVKEAFESFINERANSAVALAKSVTSVTVTGGVVTVALDPKPVVLETFDKQAEFFGVPVSFDDGEGVWLRETVQRVDVVDAGGKSLGSMTAAELNKIGAG